MSGRRNLDVKEKLKLYNKFITMKKKSNVKLGNLNIVLNCETRDEAYTETIDAIHTILKKHKIVDGDYSEMENRIKSGKLDERTLYIIDCEDHNFRWDMDKIRRLIKKNPNSVFIVVTDEIEKDERETLFTNSEGNRGLAEKMQNSFYWIINIDKPTEGEKIKYIKRHVTENGFIIAEKNTFMKKLLERESYEINQYLMEAFLKAFMLKKNVLEDSLFELDEKQEAKEKKEEIKGLKKLEDLTGLDDVKKQIERIVNYVEVHKERKSMPMLHMCFSGNPGSGKTSVARIIGEIFSDLRYIK